MYNNLRVTGLASPFDTEEMVEKLMSAERIKLDRVEQDKELLVWKRDIYNDLNKDYANFILNTRKEFGLTTTTSTGTMISNPYKNLSWVRNATSSNESVATVSTTAKAINGRYDVEVEQLAEGVKLTSGENITVEDGTKGNLASQFGLSDEDIIEFTLKTDEASGKYVKFKIDNEESGKLKASYDDDGNLIVTGNIDEVSLNDLAKEINNAKVKVKVKAGNEEVEKEISLGINAVYDSSIDRFFLQTKNTGKDTWININDESSMESGFISGENNLLKLNLSKGEKDDKGNIRGQNALINFDGAENIEMNSNQFNINGMDFNIKTEGNFTTTIETDIDTFYEKIENFVIEYNKMVEKTGSLLTEKRYRDYKPLTAEQKRAMDKKDIELWEEKAKSGILRSDDIISRTLRNSRNGMYESVEGVEGDFKYLFEIGISTEEYAKGTTGGKLTINEMRLKEAIRDDVDGVLELLFKNPEYGKGDLEGVKAYTEERDFTSKQLKAKRNQSGIIARLYDNTISDMKSIIEKSGLGEDISLYRDVKSNMLIDFITGEHSGISLIDKDVIGLESKIDDLNVYLARKENSHYMKFAAMEQALSRMNQQSMWLMQQFSN